MDEKDPFGWRKKDFKIYDDDDNYRTPQQELFDLFRDELIEPQSDQSEPEEEEMRPIPPELDLENQTSSEEEELPPIENLPDRIQAFEQNNLELIEDEFLSLVEETGQNDSLVKRNLALQLSPFLHQWRTTQDRLDDESYLQYLINFQNFMLDENRQATFITENERENFNSADTEKLDQLCREFFRARQRERQRERQIESREQNQRQRQQQRQRDKKSKSKKSEDQLQKEQDRRDRRDRGDDNSRPNIRFIR